MGATHIALSRGRNRELRVATLALIVERPGHGYELANRLNRRLGPTWQIEPKLIYSILDDFARSHLVTAVDEASPDRPRQTRTVYHATENAPDTLRRWMRSELEVSPVRPDVIARIAAASPGDAEELLRVLDEYEGELLRLLEAIEVADPPIRSWRGLLMAIARSHTDSYLQAEFQWVVVARRRIRDFVSAEGD